MPRPVEIVQEPNIYLYNPPEEDIPIGRNVTIRFMVSDRFPRHIDVYLTDDGVLTVRGDHALQIMPEVANSIRIKNIDPYREERR